MSNNNKKAIYYHTNWAMYSRNYDIADLPKDTQEIVYSFLGLHKNTSTGLYEIGYQTGYPVQNEPATSDNWADFQVPFNENSFIERSLMPFDEAWPEGTFDSPKGNYGQMNKMASNGYITRATLSIGGWSYSTHFSDACLDEANRNSVCMSVINHFKVHKFFKGISFDWEYPSNQGASLGDPKNKTRAGDGDRFVLLCKKMRELFNANNMTDYTISAAISAAPEKIEGHLPLKELNKYLDEFHIMTYDFQDGTWPGNFFSGHHCNLYHKPGITAYSADESAQFFISKGIPSNKLFIGAAFYSRGFGNTALPLGSGCVGGSKYYSYETGMADYQHIKNGGIGVALGTDVPRRVAEFSGTEYWDDEMRAAYSYNPDTKDLISYDNERSLCEKVAYIHQHNLGGIIIWESSNDGNLLKTKLNEIINKGCDVEPRPEQHIMEEEITAAEEDIPITPRVMTEETTTTETTDTADYITPIAVLVGLLVLGGVVL